MAIGLGSVLDAGDRERLARGIADERLHASVDGHQLVVEDEGLEMVVSGRYERLMRLNRAIHAAAKRAGKPIEPYKPLDRVNLILAVLAAPIGGVAALMHEVIWRQPFANANHRTAIAAAEEELGINRSAATLRDSLDQYLVRSKALLDGSDTSLSNAEAKQQHMDLAEQVVGVLQSRK